MQNIKTLTLSLIIGISLAAGITFAATNWQNGQGCTDCGTDGITTGSTISAENIKANFDYLYNQVATGGIWTKDGTSAYYNDGNVGIGTVSPSYRLDVNVPTSESTLRISGAGSGYTAASLLLESRGTADYRGQGVYMLDILGGQEWYAGTPYANTDRYMIGRSVTGSHSTATAQSSNAFLMISNAGNVGIGTTAPSNKLEVAGKIEADAYCDRSGQNCKTAAELGGGSAVLYGGSYLKYKWTFTGATSCSKSNIITGNCSCPSGYSTRLSSRGAWYNSREWDLQYLGYTCEKVAN